MAEWIPRGQVVKPATTAAWRVKRNGKYVSDTKPATSARRSPGSSASNADSSPKLTKAERRARRRAEAHREGEACGAGNCEIPVCADAWRTQKEAAAANQAAQQAERHRKWQPCGIGKCDVSVCAQAHRSKLAAKRSRADEHGATTSPHRRSASSPTREQRRAELHGKGLSCGQPGCKDLVCQTARRKRKPTPPPPTPPPKPRNTKKRPSKKRTASPAPLVAKGAPSGTSLITSRPPQQNSQQPVARTQPDPGPAATKHEATQEKTSRRSQNQNQKQSAKTMTCRECLRTKSINAFPDPSRRRCGACGGQPRSRSVRTVSGGAPGLGKRR